ncbi:MAG: hypothetical protein ACW98F_00110 [Candidatus Hodarchaeales archaeon]|jgi:hypothetical protein
MLRGVDLPEINKAQELALMIALRSEKRLEHYRTMLIAKAVLISGIKDTNDKNKAIDEYNEILKHYQDEMDPSRVKDRKKAVAEAEDMLKNLKGSLRDFLGKDIEVTETKELENTRNLFNKLKNRAKNWEKIDA